MNILILKGFNNYYNRIALKYDSLSSYRSASESYFNFGNINFNPNDGVTTEIVIGNDAQQIVEVKPTEIKTTPLDWEFSGSPDYLVAYEDGKIKSRWYIIECKRNRSGQYLLRLKRDTIVDNYEAVVTANSFIEKGVIESIDDPAIFNKEPIETNQIKDAEFLLKDETQCGWVVGYVAKDRWDGEAIVDTEFASTDIPDDRAEDSFAGETYASLEDFENAHSDIIGTLGQVTKKNLAIRLWCYKEMGLKHRYRENEFKINLNTRDPSDITYSETGAEKKKTEIRDIDGIRNTNTIDGGIQSIYTGARWDGRPYNKDYGTGYVYGLIQDLLTDNYSDFINAQISSNSGVTLVDESRLQKLNEYINKNKIVKIANRYYEVVDDYSDLGKEKIVQDNAYFNVGSTPFITTQFALHYGPYDAKLYSLSTPESISWSSTANENSFRIEYSITLHKLTLREKFAGLRAKMPINPKILNDAPYYMFAIPFSDDLAIYNGNSLHCVSKKSVAIQAAQAIATKNGAGTVYDVQLLPYCPVRDAIKTQQVSAHYTLARGTVFEELPGPLIPNHKYVLRKVTPTTPPIIADRFLGQKTIFRSQSAIYINYDGQTGVSGTALKNVIAKKIELISGGIYCGEIRFYSSPTSNIPFCILPYQDYIDDTDNYLSIMFTDQPTYGYQDLLSDVEYYEPNEEKPTNLGLNIWAYIFDYIYHENYFLSKVDISNCITSNIVKVSEGVEGDIVSTIFWATDSKFTFDKYLDDYYLLKENGTYQPDSINIIINEHVKRATTVQDIKFKNQSEMMRLASPNYSNFFDMNVERNKGIEFINIDCTYRPFSPYIHLNPNFKGLYGQDFDDVRGLICGGDFSIALTTDAWANYQLQNKNYQAIFDRQIQSIETTNAIQKRLDVAQAIGGTFTGAASGAFTGAMASGGNPYAAIAGAVIGGTASAIGGAADVEIKEQLRELQLSSSKDIFVMQLENIKALPQGLSKTNYLTNNNKLFPFLEFYTCTDIEEQAVKDMIRFNGMTINRIGRIQDFQASEIIPYIKAKLLRINVIEDAHQVQDIANELDLGMYIPEPNTIIPDEDEE